MSVISKLRVWFGADTTEAEKGFKRVEKSGGELSKGFEKLKGTIAAAFSVAAITAFLKECYALAEVQWKAEKRLEAGIKATGQAVGYTAKELKKYAAELQEVTLFGDEVTIAAMARLVPYTNVTGEVFKKTISLAQDLATVMDTDLNSAVVKLGKALNTPGKGLDELRESGIAFTEAQIAGINKLVAAGDTYNAQMTILDEIYAHVGGAATELAGDTETAFAATQQLKNTWGDLLEMIGHSPAAQQLLKIFVSLLKTELEYFDAEKELKKAAETVNAIAEESLKNHSKYVEYNGEIISRAEMEALKAKEAAEAQEAAREAELQRIKDVLNADESTLKAITDKISKINELINVTSLYDAETLVAYQNEVTRLQNVKAEFESLARLKADVAKYRVDGGTAVTGVSISGAIGDQNRKELAEMANGLIQETMTELEPMQVEITPNVDDKAMINWSNHMASVIKGIGTSLGETIAGNFDSATLLEPFADVAMQLGSLLIAQGAALLAFKTSLEKLNPYVAIAAGTALVAVASAIKSFTSDAASGASMTGGAGGSSYSTQLSDYKDTKMEVSGTLKANGNELVAVINNVEKHNRYTR